MTEQNQNQNEAKVTEELVELTKDEASTVQGGFFRFPSRPRR